MYQVIKDKLMKGDDVSTTNDATYVWKIERGKKRAMLEAGRKRGISFLNEDNFDKIDGKFRTVIFIQLIYENVMKIKH